MAVAPEIAQGIGDAPRELRRADLVTDRRRALAGAASGGARARLGLRVRKTRFDCARLGASGCLLRPVGHIDPR
jgi:hypothetical protein